MSDIYSPFSWYWVVGNKGNGVFSGASLGFVDVDDQAYGAWQERGNKATRIPTDGELADVLCKAGVGGGAIFALAPGEWTSVPPDEVLQTVEAAGVRITSTGTPSLNAVYETSGRRLQDIRDLAQYVSVFDAFPAGIENLPWAARDKQVTFTSPAELLAVARGLADYLMLWHSWVNGGMTGDAPPFAEMTIA